MSTAGGAQGRRSVFNIGGDIDHFPERFAHQARATGGSPCPLLGSRGEAPVRQAIWCTPVVSDWYKSAPKRQCVLRNILTIPATFLIKCPSSNNVITVLGAKRFRALQWSEIDTHDLAIKKQKRLCARSAPIFDNFNLISHEMRPHFQHNVIILFGSGARPL